MVTEAPETTEGGTKRRSRKASGNKPATKKTGGKRTMTDEHKRRIAEGREQAKIVDRYLTAMEPTKKKRGRKVTAESLQKKLDDVQRELLTATGVDRLNLMQEETDLTAKLKATSVAPENDIEAIQAEFVKVARVYGDRRGISKKTWLAYGVPSAVLKEAGV